MYLKNLTKNTILAKDLKDAVSFTDSALGLLKKTNPASLLLHTHFGIHTFLLKDPIDVIVLDKNNKIVKTAVVSPNKIFIYNPKFSKVLELPKGTIKKSKTQIGDKLVY